MARQLRARRDSLVSDAACACGDLSRRDGEDSGELTQRLFTIEISILSHRFFIVKEQSHVSFVDLSTNIAFSKKPIFG